MSELNRLLAEAAERAEPGEVPEFSALVARRSRRDRTQRTAATGALALGVLSAVLVVPGMPQGPDRADTSERADTSAAPALVSQSYELGPLRRFSATGEGATVPELRGRTDALGVGVGDDANFAPTESAVPAPALPGLAPSSGTTYTSKLLVEHPRDAAVLECVKLPGARLELVGQGAPRILRVGVRGTPGQVAVFESCLRAISVSQPAARP